MIRSDDVYKSIDIHDDEWVGFKEREKASRSIVCRGVDRDLFVISWDNDYNAT